MFGNPMVVGMAVLAVGIFALCCLLALLVMNEVIPPELAEGAARALLWGAVFGVCWFVAKAAPKRKLPAAGATAALAVLAGLLVKATAFPGEPLWAQGVVLTLAAGISAGFLAGCQKTKRR